MDFKFARTGPFKRSVSTLEAALLYAEEGWGVVPILSKEYEYLHLRPKRGRTPFHGRTNFPLYDKKEIYDCFTKHPKANIGIRSGLRSAIVVLDFDQPGFDLAAMIGIAPLPVTRAVHTNRGKHLYFKCTELVHTILSVGGCDVLGEEEAYAMAPPSIHKYGSSYQWEDFSVPVAPIPEDLLAFLKTQPALFVSKDLKTHPRAYLNSFINSQIRHALAVIGK